MQAFKSLKSGDHVSQLLRGRFHVRRLRWYQLLEAVSGDDSVGDIKEGVAVTNVDVSAPPELPAHLERERLAQIGISAPPGTGAFMSGVRHIHHSDCYVLCLSLSPPTVTGTIDASYDACVRFTDVDGLVDELLARGTVNGVPLTEAMSVKHGPVVYDWEANHLMTDGLAVPDVFRKRPSYQAQAEYRIAFLPQRGTDSDFFNIDCPSAAQYLDEVAVPQQPVSPEQNVLRVPEIADPLAEIKRLRSLHDEVTRSNSAELWELPEEQLAAVLQEKEERFDAAYHRRLLQCIWWYRLERPSGRIDLAAVSEVPCWRIFHVMAQEGWIDHLN